MKIIADQQIPYVNAFFGSHFELHSFPEETITSHTIKDADVLLIRSVTQINQAFIANSSVRFIGSATAGIDHIDTTWLDEANIAWAYAPGCNANAVSDYVLLSVAHLKQEGFFQQAHLRAGIIGVGYVGQRVSNTLKQLGFTVLLNDPPRSDNEIDFISSPLEKFKDLDLICLHTPLTTTGKYPTFHLLNQTFLSNLNKNCVVLNAGRGGCIDSEALKQSELTTVIDVWEQEPSIDRDLAIEAFIATPHIAGYSQAAKYRATKKLFHDFCNHFEIDYYTSPEENPADYKEINLFSSDWIKQAITTENLKTLSKAFQHELKNKPNDVEKIFQTFRKNYTFRHELIY